MPTMMTFMPTDQVDIVYVGVPHISLHKAVCLSAVAAKETWFPAEKPMAMNSKEVDEVIGAAREQGVFLMEGIPYRFLFHSPHPQLF